MREFIMTVGVGYGHRPDDDQHPLGLHGDGYTVIEAVDTQAAYAVAAAVVEMQYAFIYPRDEDAETMIRKWHTASGEELRIAMLAPDESQVLQNYRRVRDAYDREEADLLSVDDAGEMNG
jgi:hypothetical protein